MSVSQSNNEVTQSNNRMRCSRIGCICLLLLCWIGETLTASLNTGDSDQHSTELGQRSRQAMGLAAIPKPVCGTVNKPYETLPMGMPLIPETTKFPDCKCSESSLYNNHRRQYLTNGTAQVNHQAPPFQTGRVYAHRQGDQVVGCEWQWECRHSLNRFPQIYEEAEQLRRPDAYGKCGPDSKGRCRAILSKEMVLRQVTEERADSNGQQATYWGIHLENRKVGYFCFMPKP